MATESDNINTSALGTIVAVGTLVTLAVILGVTALVRSEQDTALVAQNAMVNDRPVRELYAGQLAELNDGPAWVDREKGVVSIPIERAMDIVVNEYIRNPALATPVSTAVRGEGTPTPGQKEEAQGVEAPSAGPGQEREDEASKPPNGSGGSDSSKADRSGLEDRGSRETGGNTGLRESDGARAADSTPPG